MAGQDRTDLDALKARLRDEPFRFDFFQAVRRLECAHPDLPRIGFSQRPSHDPVRFAQEPTLAFAPSAIARFDDSASPAPRLEGRFLGLLGPNGPMPLHLTEYVHDRILHHDDRALARFLDMFNHRMISLFYRAWASAQLPVSFDRPDEDRFAMFIGSTIGRGPRPFQGRDSVPDVAKLHYSGRLACPTRNAEGLRAILGDFFGLPCRIIEFVGQWLDLPAASRCRLGASRQTGLLGLSTIVGSRFWECQQKFRIRLGPMSLAKYERLLPTEPSFRRLVDWVRNYVGDQLMWDAQLVLKKQEVPPTHLGRRGRLGWTTWLASEAFERDPDDLVLTPAV